MIKENSVFHQKIQLKRSNFFSIFFQISMWNRKIFDVRILFWVFFTIFEGKLNFFQNCFSWCLVFSGQGFLQTQIVLFQFFVESLQIHSSNNLRFIYVLRFILGSSTEAEVQLRFIQGSYQVHFMFKLGQGSSDF